MKPILASSDPELASFVKSVQTQLQHLEDLLLGLGNGKNVREQLKLLEDGFFALEYAAKDEGQDEIYFGLSSIRRILAEIKNKAANIDGDVVMRLISIKNDVFENTADLDDRIRTDANPLVNAGLKSY